MADNPTQFSNASLFVLAATMITILVSSKLYATPVLRFLRRKRYQYEVTFALYMMTPTEKFILNSFLFLTLSMIFIASLLYLPEHVLRVSNRALYYYSGSGGLKNTLYSPPPPQTAPVASSVAVPGL